MLHFQLSIKPWAFNHRLWAIESKALNNLVQTIFPALWPKSYEFWLFHRTVCTCLIHWSNNFGIVSSAAIWTELYDAWRVFSLKGCRDGAVVRALASHQCGPGPIRRSGVICGLSLLVLYSAPRGFLRVLRFPLFSKTSVWLDLCSSARTTRHLNKVPFLFLPLPESAAIHLEACASSASSEGPGLYFTMAAELLVQWNPDTTIVDTTISPVWRLIGILCPGKSYILMYETETRYNDLRYNDIPDITMSF